MEEMNVPDESISSLVDEVVLSARGKSVGFDIEKSLHKALLESTPKKQRMEKDRRFSTAHGLLLTSPPTDAALCDKERNEKRRSDLRK